MSFSELLLLCFYSLFAVITAFGYGSLVISLGARLLVEKKDEYVPNIGVKILIGLGFFGNLALALGLAGLFEKTYLTIVMFPGVISSLRSAWISCSKWKSVFKKSLSRLREDLISLPFLTLAVLILGMLFLASMRPPHATDELHYHFPQAREVANSGIIEHSWDGHYFYGNIPKLIDVLFAVGLEMQGYQLAHVLNYLLLVGFVMLIYEVLRRMYGIRAGAFAALLLVLFSDYTWNATVGFVDSATSALEISSLIFTGLWLKRGKSEYLMISGMLLGLALGSKYSPLPTALLLTIVIFYKSWRKKNVISNLLTFGLPALIMGGYWYIKNWILFGNPFYPMYFGHRGVSEESYLGLMEAIWQWEPKTLPVFLEKLKRWLTYTDATTYVSIWIAPLVVLWHRSDSLIRILLAFYLLYIPYWFFLATHQTRFLLSALLVSNILLGIILSKLSTKLIFFGTAVLLSLGLFVRPYPERNLIEHYLWVKLSSVERQFALGNITEREFLHREFGCQYDVIDYLNMQSGVERVVDNWSVWHAPSLSYFASKNKFIVFTPNLKDSEELYNAVKASNIGYLYIDTITKGKYLQNTDPIVEDTKKDKLIIDELLTSVSEVIFTKDTCVLYKL